MRAEADAVVGVVDAHVDASRRQKGRLSQERAARRVEDLDGRRPGHDLVAAGARDRVGHDVVGVPVERQHASVEVTASPNV